MVGDSTKETMTLTYEREGDHFTFDFKGNKKKCGEGKNEKLEIIDHQIRILFLAAEHLNKLRRKEMRKELMLEELGK